MGQDHSSGKRGQEAEAYGNVFVKLDQDTYLSDDTVTGTVYVQLRRPYPGDKICLKVKGKEFAKWIDKEHKQRQREDGTIEHYTVDVPREADFVSVKHIVDIYDWRNGSVIPPGQFSFPISFKIPPGLPSTFFLRSGTTVAEISYYVEAYLKPEKELYPKIKHKRPITIRQALRGDITTKEVSINQEVSTCCCLSKGSVAMWTAFEKNAYAPGEEARIVTEVDNSKCELAITNVRFELVQYIKLTAQANSKALHFGIVGENLGRVEPGQAFLKEQRKEASIHLPPGIEGSAKAYKGDNQVQEYNLSPQQAISPSTNGNLIKSNFGLRVACGMDGCVCDTMPTTELPVTIYSILQRKVADPMPPAGWNPTPMPASNISIIISINGVAPGTTTSGPAQAQPQGNTLMTNSQMPTQPQQQAQYTQQSQQPLSNRQQESQYGQYQQQQAQPYSEAQSLQSIQPKPQYQQEAQYQQQQQNPLRQSQQSQQYKQEAQYRQQEQAQYQQPLSNRQSESQYQYQQQQSPQRTTQIQSQSQIQIQPKQQSQQELQYQQQQSPQRQQYQQEGQSLRKSQEYQQQQSNRIQESQYRQQEQSPPRQQYQQESQYQKQQSPTRQPQSQSQFQESQYQSNRQSESQYQQQQSPQRQQYQQESQYRQQPPMRQSQSNYQFQESQSRHQEQQSPPRQQYQQEQSQYQSNRQAESQYRQEQSPPRQQYQQESQYQQQQSPQRQQYQQESQYRQPQGQGYSQQQGGYNNSQYGRSGERY